MRYLIISQCVGREPASYLEAMAYLRDHKARSHWIRVVDATEAPVASWGHGVWRVLGNGKLRLVSENWDTSG